MRAELNPKMVEAKNTAKSTDTMAKLMESMNEMHGKHTEMLTNALQTIHDGHKAMIEAINAPEEIVRDSKTGRPVGKRKVQKSLQ